MKAKSLISFVALNLAFAFDTFAQASFELSNRNIFYGVDAPVFDAKGVPLEGMSYFAELWGGANPDSLMPLREANNNLPRWIVPFGMDGYFRGNVAFLSVLDVHAGGSAWLQVRAWDAQLGNTYEEVMALGLGGYGESPLFYADGSDPTLVPPVSPAPLIGLQSFSLRAVVPEPFTWALFALGGLGAWWGFWRRRQN